MVVKVENIKGGRVKGVYECSILFLKFLCKIKIIWNKKQKQKKATVQKKKSKSGPTFFKGLNIVQ